MPHSSCHTQGNALYINCSCTGILQLGLAAELYRQVSGLHEKGNQQLGVIVLFSLTKYETFIVLKILPLIKQTTLLVSVIINN